jgi:hypothetical protein
MGGLAVFCTLFMWFWIFTVGSFVGMGGQSQAVLIPVGLLAVLPGIVGIGIIKRRPWSRIALMAFWILVSGWIIVMNLLTINETLSNPYWKEEVIPWLGVAVIGILHVFFLKSQRVKALFD